MVSQKKIHRFKTYILNVVKTQYFLSLTDPSERANSQFVFV